MKNCNLLFKLLIMLNTLRSYYHIVRCAKKKKREPTEGLFLLCQGCCEMYFDAKRSHL